jgi:NADH-quinone oxidoreductase subunit J
MLWADATADFPLNWVVLAPVVTGFLAVWYLLPTPRRRSLANGVVVAVVAVLGFATFLFHGYGDDLPFNPESFLFSAFSLLAFTFAILMIAQRNPARAAVFFAVVVLNVCGLFLLLAAPFLMAATIIIYAGAIIVTFLFVIMLAQPTGQSNANDRCREPSLSAAVGFILLAALLIVLQRAYSTSEVDELLRLSDRYAKADVVDDSLKTPARAERFIDEVKRVRERLGYHKIDVPIEIDGVSRREKDSDPLEDLHEALNLSPGVPGMGERGEPKINVAEVKKAAAQIHYELSYLKAVRDGRASPTSGIVLSPHGQSRSLSATDDPDLAPPQRLPSANVAALGRSLFTDHLIAVELGGTLLLIATIGAVAIAGGRWEKEST